MNWNYYLRQVHRWASLCFTLVVAGIFVTLGLGREPVEWVYYLPLLPLAVLVPTGLYMFVLPYAGRRRGGQSTRAEG